MRFLKDLNDGDRVADIYMCKQRTSAVTKNGKNYLSVILQDKTGTMDAKVWDPSSPGIADFDAMDYIEVMGDVSMFNGSLQMSIKRIRVCHDGEYEPGDYLPTSQYDIEEMYSELILLVNKTKNEYLKKLLEEFYVNDTDFIKAFKFSSAAKSVHHGFVGGLLEHTLSVAKMCEHFAIHYPLLKRDLLVTAALCHDIGKIRELDAFPVNDYSDEGNLLGHIVMGCEMVSEKVRDIPGFPKVLENELKHCILAHHGEYEYGSPKKPALMEAMALNMADNLDAKMETFKELIESNATQDWLGFQRVIDSNVRMTKMPD
ncbi:MAG: HD domain-containing protein [Lachnospiraceae bacterium]|nr:HD domain-containing protein [Lachnospiraceae bacterium]MBP5745926.1 HD domain-containing protein [Lachnospiraceae bacterium]